MPASSKISLSNSGLNWLFGVNQVSLEAAFQKGTKLRLRPAADETNWPPT
jgi:hypothetical protein